MVDISASTTHKVKGKKAVAPKRPGAGIGAGKKAPAQQRRGSVAPPLRPTGLQTPADVQRLLLDKSEQDRKSYVREVLFPKALGEHTELQLGKPHAASTTRDRGAAAADVAVAARELGVAFVLKECGMLEQLQRALFPNELGGIESVLRKAERNSSKPTENTLRPSTSALSLSSMADTNSMDGRMDDTTITLNSVGTDSKRGKTTPPNAREGCLLVLRALCEIVPPRKVEPYVGGAFLAAALDECASSSSAVRAAAEDATAAMVGVSNPWSLPCLVVPLLLLQLHSTEWRVKACALERLEQCAATIAPAQINRLVPTLIPSLTQQVWNTKAQVSKAARSALVAICNTNTNRDIRPTIPALIQAICKPSDTNYAVSELMGTTFVVPVDASTLAILCPILSRALKEKLAIHKRAACIVISNMSKLVADPRSIAPFSELLVPELKKVSTNVQFDEIRDEALKALASLTKALGDLYNNNGETPATTSASAMATPAAASSSTGTAEMNKEESIRVEAERAQIQRDREVEAAREEAMRLKEKEERRMFKVAMEAQRQLDKLSFEDAQKQRQEDDLKKERLRLSTKTAGGQCQGCGLRKCKKSCVFYGS